MFTGRKYHETLVKEIEELKDKVAAKDSDIEYLEARLKRSIEEVEDLKREAKYREKENDLNITQAKFSMAKKIEETLKSSDIEREIAKAKLEIYEKMDNKDQITEMTQMLKDTIKGLSQRQVVVATKQSHE